MDMVTDLRVKTKTTEKRYHKKFLHIQRMLFSPWSLEAHKTKPRFDKRRTNKTLSLVGIMVT